MRAEQATKPAGAETWHRILNAIELLQAKVSAEGETTLIRPLQWQPTRSPIHPKTRL
jgi:hypothetical protein